MGQVSIWALVCLAIFVTPALAQPPVPQPGPIIAPYLDQGTAFLLPPTEDQVGEDLHGEDVRVVANLDVRSVDYQLVGILFGGGKVAADLTATVRIEFRGVGLWRLDEAMQAATGEANVTVRNMFGIPTHRVALTAEEIRLAGAGVLLAAFQEYQAEAAKQFLEDTVPGLTVLSSSVTWSNTIPLSAVATPNVSPDSNAITGLLLDKGGVELREPPLVLDATVRMQYLENTNIVQLLTPTEPANQTQAEAQAAQRDALLERDLGGILERPVFGILGYSQLLAFGIPPGWRMEVHLTVPEGFTVEGATTALVTAQDRRSLSYTLDGSSRHDEAHDAGVATLSSRFLVTTAALVAIILIGYVIRLPLEAALLFRKK